jgi:hypothetical protein
VSPIQHGYVRISSLGYEFSTGSLSGLFLTCHKGDPYSLTVSKGWIEDSRTHAHLVDVKKAKRLNIRRLNGKPLKPLTWYFLFLDWEDDKQCFRVSSELKEKPKSQNSRRIGCLHTTTRRTLRKFTQVKGSFVWNTEISRRVDDCWASSDSTQGFDARKVPDVIPSADEIVAWAKRHDCPESEKEKIIAWAAQQTCTARTEECGWCMVTENVLCSPCSARRYLQH